MSIKTISSYRSGPYDEILAGSGNTYAVAVATENGDNRLLVSGGDHDWREIHCTSTFNVPYTLGGPTGTAYETTAITNTPIIHLDADNPAQLLNAAGALASTNEKIASWGGVNNLNAMTIEQLDDEFQPELKDVGGKPAVYFERDTGTNLETPLDKSFYREGPFVFFTVHQFDNPIVFTDTEDGNKQYGRFDRRHTPSDGTNISSYGTAPGEPGGYYSRSSIGNWSVNRLGSRTFDRQPTSESKFSDLKLGDASVSALFAPRRYRYTYDSTLVTFPTYTQTNFLAQDGMTRIDRFNQYRLKTIQIDVDIILPRVSDESNDPAQISKYPPGKITDPGTQSTRYTGTYDPLANGLPGKSSVYRPSEHARLYGFSAGAMPQAPVQGDRDTGFYLHEVMVFNELLTLDKINLIGKHLAAKWIGAGDDSAWLQIKK